MPPRCGRWDGSPLAAFWASSAANSSLLSSALTATGWGAGAAKRGSLRWLSMVSTAAEAVGLFSLTDSVAVARADSEVCGVACELPATGGAEGTAAGAAGVAATGTGAGREGAAGVTATGAGGIWAAGAGVETTDATACGAAGTGATGMATVGATGATGLATGWWSFSTTSFFSQLATGAGGMAATGVGVAAAGVTGAGVIAGGVVGFWGILSWATSFFSAATATPIEATAAAAGARGKPRPGEVFSPHRRRGGPPGGG